MGYIEESLLPAEQVRWRTKLHWIAFMWPAILLLAPFLLGLMRSGRGGGLGLGVPELASIFMPIGLIWLILAALNVRTSEFAITDKRVLAKVGFVRRATIEIFLTKVESVRLQQTMFGRLLDYGTVTVGGTGGSISQLKNIDDPLQFRRAIQAQISGEEITGPAAPGPLCPQCNVPVPIARPVCPKCGQRLRLSRPA